MPSPGRPGAWGQVGGRPLKAWAEPTYQGGPAPLNPLRSQPHLELPPQVPDAGNLAGM